MSDPEVDRAAKRVLDACRIRGLRLATAESCTGGLVAAALTEIAGASDVVDCGFVTYSDASKTDMLGVPPAVLERAGAVSREVAEAMAAGALLRSQADVAVAITGIAGPSGATATKPIGLVHIAAAARSGDRLHVERRYGEPGREEVRRRSALDALELMRAIVEGPAASAPRTL